MNFDHRELFSIDLKENRKVSKRVSEVWETELDFINSRFKLEKDDKNKRIWNREDLYNRNK